VQGPDRDDFDKTKEELVDELVRLRREIAEAELRGSLVEQALRESESHFSNLADQSMVGIYLIQDGVFRYVNRELGDIFGYSTGEIVDKKRIVDLVRPEDRSTVEENIEGGISREAGSMQCEFQGIKKSGERVYVEIYGTGTTYRGASAVIGTLLDRSAEKKLEDQLLRSERIKAIGALAGGIAHDFNNLLMAIQGYTSLMLHEIDPADPHYPKLKGVEELVKSGSDLTRKLLGFASGGPCEVRPSDLNEVVRKTTHMFGQTRKEITVKSGCEENLCSVDADSGQIEQMLLNLYVNAWQAMPEGGTLRVETESVTLDRKFVRPYGVKAGRYARVSVTDTGEGMDEKTRERIFEPFFTTRRAGRGTGLGLASVYNIVKGHGGIIQVESEEGQGTTFHIYLPASKRVREKGGPPVPEPEQPVKGKGTILLVDDEESVTLVSKDMLEVLGYSVLVAASGQEGINLYEKNQDKIDLVVLDLVMPDMGGEQTFEHLREIKPSVRVLLTSGYSLDGRSTRMLQQGCKGFLHKPFTITVLSQKLQEVLGPPEVPGSAGPPSVTGAETA
jgi:PAS domain S-box-containing protein